MKEGVCFFLCLVADREGVEGVEGVYSFVAYLSLMTMDYASLARRSTRKKCILPWSGDKP